MQATVATFSSQTHCGTVLLDHGAGLPFDAMPSRGVGCVSTPWSAGEHPDRRWTHCGERRCRPCQWIARERRGLGSRSSRVQRLRWSPSRLAGVIAGWRCWPVSVSGPDRRAPGPHTGRRNPASAARPPSRMSLLAACIRRRRSVHLSVQEGPTPPTPETGAERLPAKGGSSPMRLNPEDHSGSIVVDLTAARLQPGTELHGRTLAAAAAC
jgi:hypothetical protein